MKDFREIHCGHLVKKRVDEYDIEMIRICNFFKCSEREILEMYKQEELQTGVLLKWSKLLEYDFFRIYTQHLILYSPPSPKNMLPQISKESFLPQFRKSIYTKEIIDFILEKLNRGEKTKEQIIGEYRIPKATLYKWIAKYNYKKLN